MNDEVMEELGPIGYVVIEFPAGFAARSNARCGNGRRPQRPATISSLRSRSSSN